MTTTVPMGCGTVVRELTDDCDRVATLVMTLPGVDGIRVVEDEPVTTTASTRTVAAVRVADGLPVRVLLVTAPLDPADRRRLRVETAELEALLTHVDPDLVAPLVDHGVDAEGRPYLVLERGGSPLVGPLDHATLRKAAETLTSGLAALASHGLVGAPPPLQRHRGGLRLDTPRPPALDEVDPSGGWTPAAQARACARVLAHLGAVGIDAASVDDPADLLALLGSGDTEAPIAVPADGRPLGSRYLLDRQIGRGATGVVWAGRRRDDGGPVAVKLLRPELAEDHDVVTRFVRERRLLVDLRHPHLVRVFDLVAEGDALGIVMELVDGEDLRRVGTKAPLSAAELATLLAQTASALAAVHAAGLVHRDIKPENVLVTRRDGRAVALLSDFGIARPVDGSAGTDLIGTPTYVAPELVAGRAPEPAVDIYALGVMAYELIAGRAPFVAPTTEALLRAHLDQPVARPDGVDDRVWQLLQECLAKVPAQRPAAADLALRWSELAGSATMDTPRPRPVKEDEEDRQPTARAARPLADRPLTTAAPVRPRRRLLWIAAAAAAVVGLAAGVLLATVRSKPATPTPTPAPGQYVVAAGLRLTDPTSVTVTWGGQAAALPGFAGYVVVDVSGATARPISETLPGDATSYVVSGVRPGRESCFLVIAVGVRAPPPDPLPQPVCVTTPTP